MSAYYDKKKPEAPFPVHGLFDTTRTTACGH
jgi:hypothetical protein